ncbi:hypothetical protein [Clostridium sp.]|jgi:hypothetical protein|uniref:hypothetical protein n=1 Tax=Clostridium sp. TaxID=1506 RepID=UPI003EED44CD
MVITPDTLNLPCFLKNNVRYYELVAEQVMKEILPAIFMNEVIPINCIYRTLDYECTNIKLQIRLYSVTG